MAIALMVTDRDLSNLAKNLAKELSEEIICWPDQQLRTDVEFAIVWRHPPSIWQQYPNLKVLCSLGAGVDQIINDKQRSSSVAITRIVDPGLSIQMAEYVLTVILMNQRRLIDYLRDQQQRTWQYLPILENKSVTILGAGKIGQVVAKRLADNGYIVSTWSQSAKAEDYIYKSYVGREQLYEAVKQAGYVISILPATLATNDLFDKAFFEHMNSNGYFINVGRGNTLDECALVNALQSKSIAGATLDVFKQEPLPENHKFWSIDNLTITPHISAITDQASVVAQIVDNFQRFQRKEPLKNLVNAEIGY
ncbi:2-hydroxyacid dehydrogenase [Colwellia sp. MEBiC06753]